MANNKINMPSSGAGITRYFDVAKTNIEFKPGHVVVLTIIVMILILLLHKFGSFIVGA